MLFRVVDSKNKFLRYLSFCTPSAELENGAFGKRVINYFNSKLNGIHQPIDNCTYNIYSYKAEELIIYCYGAKDIGHNNPTKLLEVPSTKRKSEIKNYADSIARHNYWTSTNLFNTYTPSSTDGYYVSGSTTTASTATSSSTTYGYVVANTGAGASTSWTVNSRPIRVRRTII